MPLITNLLRYFVTPSRNTEQSERKIESRFGYLLIFIFFIAALVIRIAYFQNTVVDTPVRADARQYVIYGFNLANHGTYSVEYPSENPSPDSFRSPGYPLLIAISFWLGGEQFHEIVYYTQIVIGALMVPLTFMLGAGFLSLFGRLVASLLVAFSPHLVAMSGYLLTETLFGFTFLTALTFFHFAIKKQQIILFVIAGFFFGYSFLTNETVLFIPLIFCGVIFFVSSRHKGEHNFQQHPVNTRRKMRLFIGAEKIFQDRFVKGSVVFLIVFLLFPVGWALRNHFNLPRNAVSGSTRALATMTHGAYPGFVYKTERYKYFPYREDPQASVFASSLSNFWIIFKERFEERPGRYLRWYIFEKPYYLWSWNILQGMGDVYVYPVNASLYWSSPVANATREVSRFLHPLVLLLAFTGVPLFLMRCRRRIASEMLSASPLFLFIICVYFTLLYTIFAPWPRYSVPLRPQLYLFALWVLESGYSSVRSLFKKRFDK